MVGHSSNHVLKEQRVELEGLLRDDARLQKLGVQSQTRCTYLLGELDQVIKDTQSPLPVNHRLCWLLRRKGVIELLEHTRT